MTYYVGTSGYSYPKWKGRFYPDKLPQKEMLRYYAQTFATVEINSTFFGLPNDKTVASWLEDTNPAFRFALKAQRSITHIKRLKNVEEPTDQLLRLASAVGERLGPLLFQLPPNFKKDVPRLTAFLGSLRGKARTAVEFRHESWLDEEVFGCLRDHSCALCIADMDEEPWSDIVATTDWGYLRLRRTEYASDELNAWAKRIKSQNWHDAYVYFRHEDTGTGPTFASQLIGLLNQ